ncbi:MAG: DUF447 family protein [Fuerstiella sp.]|jgi:hypothetical protein|nr:DUF447 family protein [Fuerstiella sp.]
MIVEGLLTSTNADGKINVAPMGPIVRGDFESLLLRPFRGSTTYANLIETRTAVFHVVDRVGVIARAAVSRLDRLPDTVAATAVSGAVLVDCCRWFEVKIRDVDITNERSEMQAEVVYAGQRRPYFGLNRARHAVIEAAILATRVHLVPRDEIESALQMLAPAVARTGGPEETDAFDMLQRHIELHYVGEASA